MHWPIVSITVNGLCLLVLDLDSLVRVLSTFQKKRRHVSHRSWWVDLLVVLVYCKVINAEELLFFTSLTWYGFTNLSIKSSLFLHSQTVLSTCIDLHEFQLCYAKLMWWLCSSWGAWFHAEQFRSGYPLLSLDKSLKSSSFFFLFFFFFVHPLYVDDLFEQLLVVLSLVEKYFSAAGEVRAKIIEFIGKQWRSPYNVAYAQHVMASKSVQIFPGCVSGLPPSSVLVYMLIYRVPVSGIFVFADGLLCIAFRSVQKKKKKKPSLGSQEKQYCAMIDCFFPSVFFFYFFLIFF